MKNRCFWTSFWTEKNDLTNEVAEIASFHVKSCILDPKSKEKPCISAGILKLMARFELATSSLPNGAEMFISSPKTEQKTQKIDIKWQFRAYFWKIKKDANNMQVSI